MAQSVTMPSPIPAGLIPTIEAAGHWLINDPTGWHTDNAAAVQAITSSYVGSATELAFHKVQAQAVLDATFNASFDLAAFIRAGTAVAITGTQVGTFLATITNNYRTLRASIANAATVAAVNAINPSSGWPANP